VTDERAGLAGWERGALVVAFAVAWLLRILVALQYAEDHPLAARPVIDEASYERRALEIAGGDWLGDEVFFQEPLYPYALALVYRVADPAAVAAGVPSARQRTAARHAQAFLGAVLVLLVAALARRAFGPLAGALAAFMTALYRPLLLFPSLLLKPNLFLPVLAALALALARAPAPEPGRRPAWRAWAVAGVLAGTGALLRGNVLVLLPFLALVPLVLGFRAGARRAGLACAVALLVGAALPIAPVTWRNHHVAGVFVPVTTGAGTNVYAGNNPANPLGRAAEVDWVRGIPEHELADWTHEAERRTGRAMEASEVSSFWLRETLASIARAPLLHLSILWSKLRLTLGSYEVPDNHDLSWDARYLGLLRLPWPGFGVLGWLGLAGALGFALRAFAARDPRTAGTLGWVLVLYAATIVLTVTSMRTRLALVPLLLPFGAGLAARVVDRGVRPARALAGLALAGALVWVPVIPAAQREADRDKRDYNLAVYLLETPGREAEARAIAERLAREHPRSSVVVLLRSQLAYQEGAAVLRDAGSDATARAEAARSLDTTLADLRAVVEDPGVGPRDRFRARSLAGLIQLELHAWGPASRHLERALEFDPADRTLRLALANALYAAALQEAPDEAARNRLLRAEELLEGLSREQPSDELRLLLSEVRAEIVRYGGH